MRVLFRSRCRHLSAAARLHDRERRERGAAGDDARTRRRLSGARVRPFYGRFDGLTRTCHNCAYGVVRRPHHSRHPSSDPSVAESCRTIINVADAAFPPPDVRSVAARSPPAQERRARLPPDNSEENTSELQSLIRTSYALFCLKKKTKTKI